MASVSRSRFTQVKKGDSNNTLSSSDQEPIAAWRVKLAKLVDSRYTTIVMTAFTVYALFGDDIRLASTRPSADDAFFGISTVALVFFTLELIANSISKPDFPGRFYFWLDLMATLSLVPDIGWLWEPIVGSDSGTTESTGALRAGRASRATKAGRIIRIVRLVRLIRIVKLYKHVKESHPTSNDETNHSSEGVRPRAAHRGSAVSDSGSSPDSNINEPSMVGKAMSDLTTRRVILLVLGMIIITPFFELSTYDPNVDSSLELGLANVHRLANLPSSAMLDQSLDEYVGASGSPIHLTLHGLTQDQSIAKLSAVGFNAGDYIRNPDKVPSLYRANEAVLVSAAACYDTNGVETSADGCVSFAYFSTRSDTTREALLNILKTLFVMFVLALAALMFTKDAEALVIRPIERMVHIVKQLAENPLQTVMDPSKTSPSLTDSRAGYETALLETTLTKISELLQIGFGEAGSQIIAQNMKRGGSVEAMVDGKKMRGAFGFCDIRQFTDATECLQEEVMVFVNEIGLLVHQATHRYAGAANKNVGDAFLLVWRVFEEDESGPLAQWHRQQSSKRLLYDDQDGEEGAEQPGLVIKSAGGAGAGSGAGASASALAAGKGSKSSAAVLPLSLVSNKGSADADQSGRASPRTSCRSSVPLPEHDDADAEAAAAAVVAATAHMQPNRLGALAIPAPHRASLSGVVAMSPSHKQVSPSPSSVMSETQLADNALYAFLKCMVDIENSNVRGPLHKYQQHPKIMERFPDGFRVRMGFGLHFGWAIEGAIGSKFKIDASYLSPNVNMAARLEAATKQYGTPLLMSSAFTRRLSPAARDRCRLLDSVTVKGSKLPIQLYTFDVNHIPSKFGCQSEGVICDADFEKDPYVPMLQQGMPGAFFKHFRRAVRNYLSGAWSDAKLELDAVDDVWPNDGPTATLRSVMQKHNFRAPADWSGYRELTDK